MVTRRAAIGIGLLSLASAGCGARSDLQGAGGASSSSASSSSASASSSSSSAASSGSLPCTTDADCNDGVACTTDVCEPQGCVHTPDDALCSDGIACTTDTCEPTGCVHTPNDALCNDGKLCTIDTCVSGVGCQHTFSNAPCDDGFACTTDTCDAATDTCQHVPCDAKCDDGIFCNGIERCDAMAGCVSGPPACQLGLPCSADACTEAGATCSHIQSGGCAPSLRLLACDMAGNLISISPFGGPDINIAPTQGTVWFDVAILNGRWFATNGTGLLVELVPMTNQIKASFPVPSANSLGAGPDGFLYAASTNVYRFDPNTGAVKMLGSLPAGYSSSGDAAFFGGQLFVSVDGPCGGALVQFDVATGASTILGGDGLGCVYGLGVSGNTMFIVNCDGKVGTFDPKTGVVKVLSTTGVHVYGADVLP